MCGALIQRSEVTERRGEEEVRAEAEDEAGSLSLLCPFSMAQFPVSCFLSLWPGPSERSHGFVSHHTLPSVAVNKQSSKFSVEKVLSTKTYTEVLKSHQQSFFWKEAQVFLPTFIHLSLSLSQAFIRLSLSRSLSLCTVMHNTQADWDASNQLHTHFYFVHTSYD